MLTSAWSRRTAQVRPKTLLQATLQDLDRFFQLVLKVRAVPAGVPVAHRGARRPDQGRGGHLDLQHIGRPVGRSGKCLRDLLRKKIEELALARLKRGLGHRIPHLPTSEGPPRSKKLATTPTNARRTASTGG